MTRDEAIKIMSIPPAFDLIGGEIWIQRFVALGMLKLDEPKQLEQTFVEIAEIYDVNRISAKAMFACLKANGIIVEK